MTLVINLKCFSRLNNILIKKDKELNIILLMIFCIINNMVLLTIIFTILY